MIKTIKNDKTFYLIFFCFFTIFAFLFVWLLFKNVADGITKAAIALLPISALFHILFVNNKFIKNKKNEYLIGFVFILLMFLSAWRMVWYLFGA